MNFTDARNPRYTFTADGNLLTATADGSLHGRPDAIISAQLTDEEATELAAIARHYGATGTVEDFDHPSLKVTRNSGYMALYFRRSDPIGIFRIDIDRTAAAALADA